MQDLELAIPFTLGIMTAINPCGFVMLPTWLGYFLTDKAEDNRNRSKKVLRGLTVSLIMTSSFVLLFGGLGLAVNHLVREEVIARRTPWFTVLLGLTLTIYGLILLTGRQLPIPIPKTRRGPRTTNLWSIFGFGVSYAVVSVGCAAPIFLLQIAGAFSRDGILQGVVSYLAFSAGMGAIIISLTLSLAFAQSGLAKHLRQILPYVDRVGFLALILGGTYLMVYGIYEIRLLRNPGTPLNPVVKTISDFQSHLVAWVTNTGGIRIGTVLWLSVLTLVSLSIGSAATRPIRNVCWTITGFFWLITEGFGHRGELILFPILRLVYDWPNRIKNWVNLPLRWAVPLEILISAVMLTSLLFCIKSAVRRR